MKYGEGVRLIALKESSVRSDGKKGKKRARVNESGRLTSKALWKVR